MQVNICARIIDKMVRNGEIFVSQNGSVAGYIPRGAFVLLLVVQSPPLPFSWAHPKKC